jgi:uncharacterized damage-inducible protein DinB
MADLRSYLRCYAEYNKWANEQVLACADRATDAEYYDPVVPGSRSIHMLLNHVLLMDKLWLAENKDEEFEVETGMDMLHPDRAGYVRDRRDTDDEIIAFVAGLGQDMLDATLCSDEPVDGLTEWPFFLEIAHVFRHQVHHRGQITILLQNTSAGAPKLDSLFVPERLRQAEEQADRVREAAL